MGVDLGDLDVLLVDCQATAACSAGGHLVEIGWARTRAREWCGTELSGLTTHLVKLPPGVELAPRVKQMTGIRVDALATASEPEAVWDQLLQAIGRVDKSTAPHRLFTVIHFSRFELPFLQHLHRLSNARGRFPLRIICTHEIVKRLLPEMPRRGLRAAAGYFGHGVPEERRCAPHVIATAAIWANCVALLSSNQGIDTPAQLVWWLGQKNLSAGAKRQFPMPRDRRLGHPDEPGVYRMRRSNNDLLYVGKATSLRKRIGTYFHKGRRHPEHILEMLTQARDVEVTVTGSALEAALLESDEIKAKTPPYNRALTSENRRVAFCARDFSRQAPCPDRHHPLGPLPDSKSVEAMSAAAGMITARGNGKIDVTTTVDSLIFGYFGDTGPSEGCLSRGLDVFWERHQRIFERRPAARAMNSLGARLWKERLAAAETAGEGDPAEGDLEENGITADTPDWSPESVADILEGVICRGARMVRRSRWLCMLSESVLTWRRESTAGDCLRLLVISGGAVFSRKTVPEGATLPVPPGWARNVRLRQKSIDVAAYDRLRIITTELRRLLVLERGPRVCLGPGRILGPECLTRGVSWI